MIQSLLRSMEILEILKDKKRNFSIAELAEAIDLPPSTIHRILQTFCEGKYVVRDERSHTYRLGPALISLGKAAAGGIRIQDAAHPILEALTAATGEDSYLVIPVGRRGLVIDKADGPSHLKIVEEFGYEMNLHCGAIRKALLAFQPSEFIEEYIRVSVRQNDEFPHTTPDSLQDELARIRRDGVAVSHGDYVSGAFGIGAPVFDSDGKTVGSIGIIAPGLRVKNDTHLKRLTDEVRRHAARLSSDLGWETSPDGL